MKIQRDAFEVQQYCAGAGGDRAAFFRPDDAIEVVVKSWNSENNDRVLEIAHYLAGAELRCQEDAKTIEELRRQLAIAKRQIPPKKPRLLLGIACARFTDKGELWLLNNRERGWGEFGFAFEGGWDEVFRRYNVRVVSYGVDRHGPFWLLDNIRDDSVVRP